ncbi:MAG: peptidoglycan -binding protein [Acetobacteraceae bacterium]|nr:peptidoglycan -binding protein [Acetobacteraceae bacterium]
MSLRRRSSSQEGLTAWPGYVDALSTLLMVIIFVLLVFVLAQAFLSVALSGRDKALERMGRQMAEISNMLALEKGTNQDLQLSIATLTKDLADARAKGDNLAAMLNAAGQTSTAATHERDALRAERDRLNAQLSDAQLQLRSAQARAQALQSQVGESSKAQDSSVKDLASQAAQLAAQVRALQALRDDLERKAQDAAVRATTAEERAQATAVELAQEKQLGDSARAQMALLNQQIDQVRLQLAGLAKALDASEASNKDKDVQIADLGQRLNVALARKVEELQRYRSEFFGKLSAVLAGRPGISVVGDRFVFQSEVLFPIGSADLTQAGQDQIRQLASTLKGISKDIPPEVNWLLRVDGHADHQPVTGKFASNWELSSSRAITVVKMLINEGIPADRLAAAGFADNQPLDPANTQAAFAKNRRIELRLTDR